jgi:hypothetical protein
LTTQVGDVLVVLGATAQADVVTLGTITNTGTAQTWTQRQTNAQAAGNTWNSAWTCVCATAQTMTVSLTRSAGTTKFWGFSVSQIRGSDGVGASAKTAAVSGIPVQALTTTAANSMVLFLSSDWNALDGSARAWRTINSAAMTEQTYYLDGAQYTVYIGRTPDAGAAGANTYGLTGPTGQVSATIAIEIKGAAAAVIPASLIMQTRRAY